MQLSQLYENNWQHQSRAYLRGRGGGLNTRPKIFQIFLKSEGKEVERKRIDE